MVMQNQKPAVDGGTEASWSSLITGVDHVAIAVTDLEKAVSWYENCLGFDCKERRVTSGEHTAMKSAVMKAGNAVVVLIMGTSPESQVSRFIEEFGPGVQHLAFNVSNLEEALRRLSENGGELDTKKIEDGDLCQVFLRRETGSGVRVELIERGDTGSFSDKSIDRLFRTFESDNLY